MSHTTDYKFENLNPYEFQDLINDLFSRKLQVELQSYSEGKDGGIDLRYSTEKNKNEIVIQVKHLKDNLTYSAIKDELPKVKELKPSKYLIVASSNCRPKSEDKIVKEFKEYIKSANNIYHRKRLNLLMGKSQNSDLEIKYFRLWLTSSNVARNFFNNAITSTSSHYQSKIKDYQSFVVINEEWEHAYQKLKQNKILLITGMAGVGKTTLSFWLISKLINESKGTGTFTYIDSQIKEGLDVKSLDNNRTEFFLFDDIFGETTLALTNLQNQPSTIINFIEQVRSSPNKYFILTCRTHIYYDAENKSEQLRFKAFTNNFGFEIKHIDFDKIFKAKILLQHLYKSDLEVEFKNEFIQDDFFLKVIEHNNFNPRLIQLITAKSFVERQTDIHQLNYKNFVLKNLKEPTEVWRNSFSKEQLNEYSRLIIYALYSFGGKINKVLLEDAYSEMLKTWNKTPTEDEFDTGIKVLLDTFITSSISPGKEVYFKFQNQSIEDFLHSYINNSEDIKSKIFQSSVYIEQIKERFFPRKFSPFLHIENSRKYFKIFMSLQENLDSYLKANVILGKIEICSTLFTKELDANTFIKNHLGNIKIKEVYGYVNGFEILNKNEIPSIREYTIKNWEKICDLWYEEFNDLDDFSNITRLFKAYNRNFSSFYTEERDKSVIEGVISEYIKWRVDDFLSDESNDLFGSSTEVIDENGPREDIALSLIQQKIFSIIEDTISEYDIDYMDLDIDWLYDIGTKSDDELKKAAEMFWKTLYDSYNRNDELGKLKLQKEPLSEEEKIKSMFWKL